MRTQGTVKWFNDEKGYGFIERDDKEKDCFVHFSSVENIGGGRVTLQEGERVEFDVSTSAKGSRADNVKRLAT